MPDFSKFSPQQVGSLRLRALQRSKVLDEKHQSGYLVMMNTLPDYLL